MNFSEFAKILHPYCSNGNIPAEFVKTLVDNIMESPLSHKDIDNSINDNYNPLASLELDTLRRIYNNKYSISKKNVSIIKGKLDKHKFAKYINEKSLDAQLEIANTMKKYIGDFDEDDVGASCAELFSHILDDILLTNISSKEVSIENLQPKKHICEVPLTTVFYDPNDSKIHIGKEQISIPKELQPSDKIEPKENVYVNKLFEAYSDAEKIKVTDEDSLSILPKKYQNNFTEQRKNYTYAEYMYHSVRDVFADGDKQFDLLIDDTYDFVSITWEKEYKHGYERLISVLEKAVHSYSTSALSSIHSLISPKIKKGICHLIVTNKDLSWVINDE